MRKLAVTVIAMGMLAPGCTVRGTPQEVLNPVPAFTAWEPQRAPLLIEEEQKREDMAAAPSQDTPAAAIVIVGMTEPGQAPELEPVYFAFGSSALDPADMEQLGQAARWLRQHPDQRIVIEGHTDAVGASDYNLALGEQRARAVRDYLIQLGVAEGRMEVVSMGEEQPVSAQRGALNRRSEVVPVPGGDDAPDAP
jgi:peptidoglycan-associated lipoprotein